MTEIMLLVGVVVFLGGGVIFLSWLIWGSSYFDESPAPKARSEGENYSLPKAEGQTPFVKLAKRKSPFVKRKRN